MEKIIAEFKEFAIKGNVVDLAIGVIIGGAFGKIVTSFVNDIIMPLLSVIIGGYNISALAFTVQKAGGETIEVKYGLFLQNTLDFFLIAVSIFLAVRMINLFKKKEATEQPPAAPPSQETILLTEIRDLLKNK
jgi:large conductance mechanosensitive channel